MLGGEEWRRPLLLLQVEPYLPTYLHLLPKGIQIPREVPPEEGAAKRATSKQRLSH